MTMTVDVYLDLGWYVGTAGLHTQYRREEDNEYYYIWYNTTMVYHKSDLGWHVGTAGLQTHIRIYAARKRGVWIGMHAGCKLRSIGGRRIKNITI